MSTDVYNLPQVGRLADDEEHEQSTHSTAHAAVTPGFLTGIHRDPSDVKLILSMAVTLIVFAACLIISLGLNVYQHVRVPDRIIVTVDRSTGSVLEIDNRRFGSADGVSVSPDRIGKSDKQYLADKFCESFYAIDPKTRPQDVERALRMMTPQAAKALVELMAKSGELERQRQENWQAVWEPQSVTVDQADPYKVNIVGMQNITRLRGAVAEQESRQLMFTLKLVADPKGRETRNQNSGFLVADILGFKQIPAASPSAPSKLTAAPQ